MWLLWNFSLAASFLLPARGEVVRNFSPCNQFFLDGKPPNLKPMNPARICQFYLGKYRFATMYDKTRRIPLFSAYRYQPGAGTRTEDWMIEPQLAVPWFYRQKSMESENTCGIDHDLLADSQALSEDYAQAILYDKGHLTPVCHQPDQDSKAATFTLTNIVPEFHQLNNGQWAAYERDMSRDAAGCLDTYVIVGAVPGNKFINNSVNIPSHIWAAACCKLPEGKKKSWAVIAKNNQNKVDRLSLSQLQDKLRKKYMKKEIDLFNGACYSSCLIINNDISCL